MSYSFDEIMDYHSSNRNVYDEIKRYLPRLVPFVGAGLTQFAYYSWDKALEELSKMITNRKSKQEVKKLIKSKLYDEAAQKLEDFRTPANLALDLAALFSADKLELKKEDLPKQAIFLLPYLFPELVLTTNFDETLETVYNQSGQPSRVYFPGHPMLLTQLLRQGGERVLLKLHGTLTGGLIDYEKIVFTRNQYNKHYGEGSSLPDELKTCFENRMMFFLGCSLENDRTMELLQEINKDGCYYYTIIGCKKSEKGNKVIDLGNSHIRAILYEDKRHEAVRVILEHLLEETNPDTYNTLSFHIGALKSIDPSERFSYKAEIMPFTGRKQEMEELNTFLGDPNVAFHWWAITGPGGCGKSRLAYEFQKHLPSGWAAHYLGADDYENLSLLTEKLTQKTLLIADYVQENAKAIGKWMEQLNERKRSLPIRVLLLERDVDEERDNAVWTKQLYEDIHHKQKLKSACYKGNFLTLQTLSDEDLLTIIENYALALRPSSKPASGALHDVTKQLLLQKLKSVDPELCRPLYAMFITDAYIEGKNPEQWDRNDILDYVTTREQDRLKFNMEQVIGKSDEKLYDACLYLQSMATVLQDASLEELQTLCPEVWAIVKEKANSFTSPSNMLEKIGLAAQGKVSALRPDLIGEYFIYTWLLEHQDKSQPFLRAAWKKPAPTAVSFARIFNDYDYLLNENAKNWELVLLKDIPVSENTALFYAMLLSDTINYCNIPEECEWQANLLQEIASKYPKSPEIAALFATGLVNLSAKQDEAGVGDTVKRLKQLSDKYPNETELAIIFASGLFNLSVKQDEAGARDAVNRLEKLLDKYPNETEIAVWFATGLVNLSAKQDEAGVRDTVKRLEKLLDKYPNETEIAASFAKSLFNLSVKQDEAGVRNTVKRLKQLSDKYPNETEIAVAFARGLFDLSVKQDEAGVRDTVKRLEKLLDKYPNETGIAASFAKSLFNLSVKQDEAGVRNMVKRLKQLSDKYPNETEIAVAFARGLFSLSNKQDEAGAADTVNRLEKFSDKYPNETEIAAWFAKGLANLITKQDEAGAADTVNRLEKFSDKYPNETEMAAIFASGLFSLSNKQDEADAKDTTVKRLEQLLAKSPNETEIAVWFAKGLVNLSAKQDEAGARDTVKRLKQLSDKYPNETEIAAWFATGLFNLIAKQDEAGAKDTVNRLEQLSDKYPNETEIAALFVIGLLNLSAKQDKLNTQGTIKCLKRFIAEYAGAQELRNSLQEFGVNLKDI